MFGALLATFIFGILVGGALAFWLADHLAYKRRISELEKAIETLKARRELH